MPLPSLVSIGTQVKNTVMDARVDPRDVIKMCGQVQGTNSTTQMHREYPTVSKATFQSVLSNLSVSETLTSF